MINASLNNTSSFNNPSVTFKSNSAKSKMVAPHIQAALTTIQGLNLKVEICGAWMWIFDANGSHEAELRKANFKWSYRRGCWYLCPQLKNTKTKSNLTRSKHQP